MTFQPRRIPQLVAHMGDTSTHPPNTMAAYQDALKSGADMIEVDVTVTSDCVAVTTHGPRLEQWTDGHGKVHTVGWDVVRGLRARVGRDGAPSEHRVPALADVLSNIDDRLPLNLDIKRFDALGPTMDLLGDSRGFGVVSGLTPRQVRRALRRYPGLPVLVNLTRLDKIVASRRLFRSRWLTRRSMRSLYTRPEVVGLNLNHRWVDQELVQRVHDVDTQVWVYTASTQGEVDLAVARGVDSITVDSSLTTRV